MPTQVTDRLINWATDYDEATITQALKTSRLAIVAGHVALMPDAHVGIGATVGSVIPTEGAIIPAAVGVDIGCGMIAVHTDLSAADLPDTLEPLLSRIEQAVPAGVGRGHDQASDAAAGWLSRHCPPSELSAKQMTTVAAQFGTLGSGNHFVEVCLDEGAAVWLVLHSGSRGIGNQLAKGHINTARRMAAAAQTPLEDPDLAYFVQGQPEFDAYIADMHWAQDYALANREAMMDAALSELLAFVGRGAEVARTNCHHNFSALEVHDGRELWITRKGAIKAGVADMGVIPGSMGTCTYVVRGRGNAASWESCSHGAGRRHSRTQARKLFTTDDLAQAMTGKTWLAGRGGALVDEIPAAYKDIDQVMANQVDLVEVVHTLTQVLNYKGT